MSSGSELYRRDVMRRTGAVVGGGVIAGAGAHEAGMSPVGDAEAALPAIAFIPVAASVVGFSVGSAAGFSLGDYLTQPDNNETALHQACMTAREWYSSHHTVVNNVLEDTATLASIEARNAIATAFEDGENAQTAHSDAQSAIYEYYDQRITNHIEVGRAVMTQLALQSDTARNSSEFLDEFLGTGLPTYSGSGSLQSTYLTTETVEEVSYDLPSGEAYTVEMPQFVAPIDNGDQYEGAVDSEWVSNYDAQAGETTLETADGNDLTGDWTVNIANVPEANLPSEQVFEPVKDFVDVIEQIGSQAATIAANYTQTFVDDLFAELDAGNISPTELRGAAGMARFLSGTDDVHDSRFRMALASQLGMEQPNLSNTAHMTVTYSGATEVSRSVDPVETRPSNFVADQQYSGMLFGQDVPGIVAGKTIAVQPTVYVGVGGTSGDLRALDNSTGEERWTFSGHSDGLHGAAVSPLGDAVYSFSYDADAYRIDPSTGDSVWTYDGHSSQIKDAVVSPDGSVLYTASSDSSVHAVDTSDGTTIWSYTQTTSAPMAVAVSRDGSTVIAAAGDAHAINASDGSQKWTYTQAANDVDAVACGADQTCFLGDAGGTIHAVDLGDGTQQWTKSDGADALHSVTVTPDGSLVIAGSWDNSVTAFDVESQSVEWDYTGHGAGVHHVASVGDGSSILSCDDAGNVHMIEGGSGAEQWSTSISSDAVQGVAALSSPEATGMVNNAYFFESDTGDEITLRDGVLTVDSMQDSEGQEIEITTDETISYIEDADGRSIEEIVGEIDEIDGVDDVTSLEDLELIVAEASGVDSVDELPINTQEWSAPEYDSYDADQYVEYIDRVEEEYRNALENSGGGGIPNVGVSNPFGAAGSFLGSLVSVAVIAISLLFGYNIVSDS